MLGGVQKGGTTTLHALMSQLVGLAPPADGRKELHFFDDETRDWSAPDYAALHAAFDGQDADSIWFESTPVTLYWPPCLERVKAYNPDMKFVFIFRDPVLRAFSQWAMQWNERSEKLPFSEALAAEIRLGDPQADVVRRQRNYLRRGLYAKQLERARRLFDPAQMLLLSIDELAADPAAVLARVAAFTGTSLPDEPRLDFHLNARAAMELPSRLGEHDVALLAEHLAADTGRFAALSGINVSQWLSDPRRHGREGGSPA